MTPAPNTDGLFLDFETSSHCDLKLHGLARYLVDPSTRAYCFTFALPGMRSADLWEAGQPVPRQIIDHITAGRPFRAHNAGFDFHVWNGVLRRDLPALPALAAQQVQCSAARARYNGLPGSLARACDALGLPVRKDTDGSATMLAVATNPDWTPLDHPDEFRRVYDYALTDTNAMMALWAATRPMPDREQRFWQLDLEINTRGFGCDVEAAEGMAEMADLANAMIDFELQTATGGALLSATEVQKIRSFAATQGEELTDAGRESIKNLLARGSLPPALQDVLELRLDASRAPKKHGAILRAHVDGRMCHSTVYHGALSGRSTAMGCGDAQLLNVARPRPGRSAEQCEQYLEAARRRDFDYLCRPDVGPPLAALADAQRPLFRATKPGHTLVCADLSGIEARFAPWCANDEGLLQEAESGTDGYVVEAMSIFDLPAEEITKDYHRQIGKMGRLLLQFGGGDQAVINGGRNYGMEVDDDLAKRIVYTYRLNRPAMTTWWATLEYAVLIALDQPGTPVRVPIGRGHCSEATFLRDDTALRMELPSGRAISYHNARLHLEPGASAPVAVYDKPEGYVETLDRKILSNNMVQGLARDLFWEAMVDVAAVEEIVHHVYDEVVLEVPEDRAELRLQQLIERFRIAPRWAPGLPLDAAGFVNPSWRKD